MSSLEVNNENNSVAKIPLLAAVIALIGIGDAVYLTVHHFSGEEVPCNLVSGCELVLNSAYSEIAGIPLALFGALAYFSAFSLAILAAFGNKKTWLLFGGQVVFMFIFSLWLIYLQAYVIGAYCQFCLISAGVTTVLFILYLASRFVRS